MKKTIIGVLSLCMITTILYSSNPVKAIDFSGQEDKYMKLCSSSTLSKNDESTCKSFNSYLKEKNSTLKSQIKDTKTQIDETKNDLTAIGEQINTLQADITAKEEEITYLDTSIKNLEETIKERENTVKERMYAMQSYINDDTYTSFIFGASDFTDMFSRIESVNELTSYDKELIESIMNDKKEVETQKETVSTAKANLEEQKKSQQYLQEEYLNVLAKQGNLLTEQEHASDEIEANSKQITDALENLASKSEETEIGGGVTVTGDSEVGKAIANAALTRRGMPYTWGAVGPNTFDCSGLVYWAYNQAGVKIGRTTASGYSKAGKGIDISEAQAGDVVTFTGFGYICHIGIFIDSNTIVHAAGQANEIAGQWGGKVRVNSVYQTGLDIHNVRRMY